MDEDTVVGEINTIKTPRGVDISIPFETFPKIPRWKGAGVCITEKIDGTNAQIYVPEEGGPLQFGSRNRWVSPENDNQGFARWGVEHEEELRKLGPGRHYGEWWGKGIQRGYNQIEKRFSLFNTERWNKDNPNRPECCGVVPELYRGELKADTIEGLMEALRKTGSIAAPGYPYPEGIVIYHYAGRNLYKYTLEGDHK